MLCIKYGRLKLIFFPTIRHFNILARLSPIWSPERSPMCSVLPINLINDNLYSNYWGFHEKGTFSYLCALGINRYSPLNECTLQVPFIWNQLYMYWWKRIIEICKTFKDYRPHGRIWEKIRRLNYHQGTICQQFLQNFADFLLRILHPRHCICISESHWMFNI